MAAGNQFMTSSVSNDSHAVVLCTAGYDRTIRFWEALSGICSRTLQHPDSQVNRLAISHDKRYVAAAGNPHVRVYEATTTNPNHVCLEKCWQVASLEGHKTNVTAIAFQKQTQWMASGSEDGTLKLWDMRIRGPQREFAQRSPVNDVIIHPNQTELISCDQNGSIKIWDLGSNACTHELVPEEDIPMRSVSMATDGSLLTAGNNSGHVFVWRMHATQSSHLATSAAVVNEDDMTWELQPVTKIQAHKKYLLRSILSPDVRRLATTSADSSIKVWSIEGDKTDRAAPLQFQLERTLIGHQRWVWDCVFSADSEYLVSASSDHTSRLWDLASGDTIRQYQGHHKAVTCVALRDTSV